MRLDGISHVHSTHSGDGQLKIGEIAKLAGKKGLGFALLTEHAEKITPEVYRGLVEECSNTTTPLFHIIPGLEFAYDDYVHLLGIGLFEHPGVNPLKKQIREIHSLGGLAVLAHPNACQKVPYSELGGLDGVEAWNTRYLARYAPQAGALKILSQIREQEGRNILCFGGIDLHETRDFSHLTMSVELEQNTSAGVINALKSGDFYIRNGLFRLGALETPSALKKTAFAAVNGIYELARQTLIKVNYGSKTNL